MRPGRDKISYSISDLEKVVMGSGNAALTIAIDIETTSLNVYEGSITWLSWCVKGKDNFPIYGAIPIKHRNPLTFNCDERQLKILIKRIFLNKKNTIIMHNAKFDLSMLVSHDWIDQDEIKALVFDTLLASYILSPVKFSEGGSHSLKRLYKVSLRQIYNQ